MSNSKEQVRIQLTPEQKAVVKTATGKTAPEALELSVMELEERIAPITPVWGTGAGGVDPSV